MGFYLFIVFVDLKSHTRCLPVWHQEYSKLESLKKCDIFYLLFLNYVEFWNIYVSKHILKLLSMNWKFLSDPCSWVLSKQNGNQSALLTLRWLADLFQYKGWSSKTCKSSIITSKDTNLLVKKETSIRISGKIIDHAHICYFYLPNPK